MKRVSVKSGKTSVVPSSGNVFADLQLPNAEEKQTKVRLAVTINQIIASANLSPAAASDILEADQSVISSLANYQLQDFSTARMMKLLNALGKIEAQGPSGLLAR